MLDAFIIGFDRALKTLTSTLTPGRESPASTISEPALEPGERRHAAALMRVNHTGEVCAQALYQAQAFVAKSEDTRKQFERAAREEEDHLAWTQERIEELGGRTSLLNPLWYAGSFAIGLVAGLSGDRRNLGFVVETERQVEEHLSGHLDALPMRDDKSRAVVAAMREDEARHGATARDAGAEDLPLGLRLAMRATARIMTATAYRI